MLFTQSIKSCDYFEQIDDEKRYKATLEAQKLINKFIIKYADTDYAIDLKFKNDLIQNQLAAKNYTLQNIIFLYKNGYSN